MPFLLYIPWYIASRSFIWWQTRDADEYSQVFAAISYLPGVGDLVIVMLSVDVIHDWIWPRTPRDPSEPEDNVVGRVGEDGRFVPRDQED